MPSFFCCFFCWLAFDFIHLHVRLLTFFEEILSKQIQDGIDAFVGVLLAIPSKCWIIFSQNSLEQLRRYTPWVVIPHLINQFCIRHHQSPISAKRIWLTLLLQFRDELVVALEEERCQLVCVAQTLQTRVHVASVAKIRQPNFTIIRVWVSLLHLNLSNLFADSVCTWRQVESLVSLSASFVAVSYAFTFADHFQRFSLSAKLTITDVNSFLSFILIGVFRCTYFNDDALFVSILFVSEVQRCAHVWLYWLAWELDTRILFYLGPYFKNILNAYIDLPFLLSSSTSIPPFDSAMAFIEDSNFSGSPDSHMRIWSGLIPFMPYASRISIMRFLKSE